jgi:choline dehydrogenase
VRLKSAKPGDRPIVDARFLSHPDDVKALAHGIELAREIGNSAAMSAYVKREVAPAHRQLHHAEHRVRRHDGKLRLDR